MASKDLMKLDGVGVTTWLDHNGQEVAPLPSLGKWPRGVF